MVPGSGPRNARILIVGEAPSYKEVQEGRPFVGDAGQELDKLLKAANIQRESVYITNAALEQVRGDKDAFFFSGGEPTPTYMAGIVQLYNDIQEIRPNVVVTLGNYAMYALTGMSTGIMKHRGSILWSKTAGVKVIPTIHPAALLRGKPDDSTKAQGGLYKYRNPVIWDLQRAKEQSAFPDYRPRRRELLIDPTGDAYDYTVDRLSRAKTLTFDIESWGGTKLACIGFSDGDPEWAATFSTNAGRDNIPLFRSLLESAIPKVGQNLMYDTTMLDQNGIFTNNVWYDTMIGQHALLPDLPKSLEFMTSIYTDIPYYKDDGKVWNKPRTPELERQYYEYNAKDVCATTEIAIKQLEELEQEKLHKSFERSMKVFEPLRKATFRGFKCDINKLRVLMNETIEARDKAQAELDALAGYSINAGSHVQVKKLLYVERNLSDRKNQSSDAPTILNIAARTGDPAPYLIIKTRKAQKLLSNYYNIGILSKDARVRFGFNPVGTFGARISSSAPLWGPGLNGQNIPAKAREMLVADDGYTIVDLDQAQAEAVIVAYSANDPVHMDCFRNGKDVHRVTACLLLDKPTTEWASIPKKAPIRDLAKVCNHELNYNAGPGQFQLTVNEEYDPEDPESVKIDFPTAQSIRNKYLQTRPALPAWWEAIRAELKLNRTLTTPLGRRYQFLDQWSDSMLKKAYSYKPQCTVGEATNIGICNMLGINNLEAEWDDRYKLQQEISRLDFFFSLQVHDSTVWQVRDDQVDEFVRLAMPLLEVPLVINGYNIIVAIEGTASKMWSKDPNKVRNLGISRKSVEI